MKQWMRVAAVAAAAVPAFVGVQTPAHAETKQAPAQYRFAVIADSTNNRFDPAAGGCVAINDKAQAAFTTARLNGTQVVVRSTRGNIDLISTNPRQFEFIGYNPSINDKGEVSFSANPEDAGEGIYRGSGGALTVIGRTEPGPYAFFGSDTSLNNGGDVAFRAELDDQFDQGLFVGNGRKTQTYFRTSTSPFGGTFSGPAINEKGQVAFFEFPDAGGEGVFRSDGRNVVTIADSSGLYNQFGDVAINNKGVVAFDTILDEGGQAILTGAGGALTTIINTNDGTFVGLGFGGASINDAGTVAFNADLASGEQGIFTGPNPATDQVIGTGDTLAGSTVSNLVFCREGLNNKGELGFLAQLEDGRSVVVVATPRRNN